MKQAARLRAVLSQCNLWLRKLGDRGRRLAMRIGDEFRAPPNGTSDPSTPPDQPPAPPLERAAEEWGRWWPAGLAGLGLAMTVLTWWIKKRNDGKRPR